MKDRRVWTNAELKQRLRNALPWCDADLCASEKRPNEYLWENRVNNALANARANSLHSTGMVESAGHGAHRITDHGFRYITDDYTAEEILRDFDRGI